MTFKEKIHKQCLQLTKDKILSLQQTLNELRESASNETKSTAGDKHETALAMLQIEQENTNKQLENALAQKLLVEKINPSIHPILITAGSLVKTNLGYFFISTGLGKITVDRFTIIALSPQSPLGQKLMGLKQNDCTEINGTKYLIENIE